MTFQHILKVVGTFSLALRVLPRRVVQRIRNERNAKCVNFQSRIEQQRTNNYSAVEDVEGALHRIGVLNPQQAVVQGFDRLVRCAGGSKESAEKAIQN